MYKSYQDFAEKISLDTVLPYLGIESKTTALNVIADALFLTYGDYDINKLVIRCEVENEACIFSKHICSVLNQSNIDESIWVVIREIIRFLPVSIFFINKIDRFNQDIYDIIIPSRVKKKANFDKTVYINMIDRFKQVALIETIYSLKIAFGFVYRFLETYDFHRGQFLITFTKQDIITFCSNDRVKLNKLQIFLNKVLNLTIPDCWFDPYIIKTDFTLITTKDIETLYLHVKDKPYEELIFLMLLTTNITLYGLLKIKLQNIALIHNFKIVIKSRGYIDQKRSKTFPICSRVAKLLETYLLEIRPATSSEYLFLNSYRSVYALMKKNIKECGLNQKKFKPIIFRCTYSRSLSLCGNSSDEVLERLHSLVKSSLM